MTTSAHHQANLAQCSKVNWFKIKNEALFRLILKDKTTTRAINKISIRRTGIRHRNHFTRLAIKIIRRKHPKYKWSQNLSQNPGLSLKDQSPIDLCQRIEASMK